MEHKNKVYINPNFKRIPQTHTSSLEESKTTYFNKYFPKELPPKHICQSDDANRRKIYVNPNFIAVKNTYNGKDAHVSDDYIRNYNSTIHLNQKATNTHCFVNKEEIKWPQNYVMLQNRNTIYSDTRSAETNCIIKQSHTTPEVSVQPVNNILQAPLSKSRYCIVRKKNESQTTSNVSLNNNMQNKDHSVIYSAGNSTSNKNTVINQKMKLCNMPPQKVTKIKISKYKTIPINYLKANSQILTNKIKSSPSIQPFNKVQLKNGRLNSSLLATFSKNRFKFVKSKPVNSIVDIKPVFKTSQLKLKRNISLNKSKINIKAKFKINNIPCRLFSKFGKCLRKDYGKCEYLHDKKHVSLCRKFLKGICHDICCTLSHELSDKKMPTCYFYLKGMCTKDNCPYLHIKLSDTTKICQDFIKGYCEKGDKCPFRHVKKQELKDDKLKSNISRNQQKRITKNKSVQNKLNKMVYKINKSKSELQEKCEVDLRYYDDSVKNESSCEIIKPTRCKLGTLPSFIQL